MSRTLKEPNRIYVESIYSGMEVGYITVNEATAEFVGKTTVLDKHNHGTSNTLLSFNKNSKYFYKQLNCDSTYISLNRADLTSCGSKIVIKYHQGICRHDANGLSYTFTRNLINSAIKTISVFYDGYWYMPAIEVTRNNENCSPHSCQDSLEHILMIYYSAENSSAVHSAMDFQCIGRQKRGYSTKSAVFEFGEGNGELITFADANKSPDFEGTISFIEYSIFRCRGNRCTSEATEKLDNCSDSGYSSYSQTTFLDAKKDTGNPYVFYLRFKLNGTTHQTQYVFNRDGTVESINNFSDSYGFSIPIGTTTNPINNQTYNLFFMGYFDTETNQFKIGLKPGFSSFENSSGDNYFLFNQGAYSNYNDNQYKVTHNDETSLEFINYFYSHVSGDELGLNSPRSLRVSTGLDNKVLKDEAACNGEEDFVLIGDYFYYCVSSCSSYFDSLTLETTDLTHTCENKIIFTDFGKTNHRCVAGFVDNADNCPDLMFNGSDNYKFKYTLGNYIEYRFDCGEEYILKPSGERVSPSINESGTCGTCDYSTKKILESATHVYYDASGARTTQKRKYCLDSCNILSFVIVNQINDGGVTKSYCTETCVAASSNTTIPDDQPFHDPTDSTNQCKTHCPAERNYLTSASSTANIDAIMRKPVCNHACTRSSHRIHQANFTDAYGQIVVHKYCLNSCTTDGKLFTREHNTHRECVTSCPSDEGFYYRLNSTDPQYCVSKCPSNFPYITGHHTHTGPPADITTGHCKSSCDRNSHFKYEISAGLYLCLEQCYPNPNTVTNSCSNSTCETYRSFFTPEKICVSDCPPRNKHLKPYIGIIMTIEHDSAEGLCASDCSSSDFKYMNPATTCVDCPDTCTEDAIADRIDSILAETTTIDDLNNGCTRVHCLRSRCHSDKPFFTPEKICVSDCPPRNKHLKPYIGIINTIEHDSAEGLCASECSPNDFKYMNPATTCVDCPDTCTEDAVAAIFDQVETGSEPISFLNNLCARVHCMNRCHSDKPFFTPNRICYTLCPSSHPYVRKFTGIINNLEFDSTKGQCNTECEESEFIYFNGSTQNQNFCLERCYEDKPYWDENRVCLFICPSSLPLVNPEFPDQLFTVTRREGLCKANCEPGYNFRYNIPDNSHQYYCLTECEMPKKYFIRYSNYSKCVFECPFHLRFVHPTTNECLSSCPPSHPYYDSHGICLEKCDEYIFEWECASSCKSGYNYVVQQGCRALCSRDIVGWNCDPYCPENYSHQINNYCAVSCLNNQFLDEVTNFKEPTEFGICKGGCDGYLIEGGVFSSGITKVYCVPACPELYMKEIRSPTERWCREKCKTESHWKFTVLGDSCVSNCIDLGFNYISEEYECLDDCSFFVDKDIWCVSKCPNERPFAYEQHCVEECPRNARFVEDFTFCVPECKSFNYDIFCVDRCDSVELAVYYTERQLDFEALPFVHSTLNCGEACNEPGFEWINETNNKCVASCPLPCQDGLCPQPEMKYKEPTKYCRETCNHEDYPFTDKESQECVSECSQIRRLFVEEDKLCLSSCPKEKPLIFEKTVCEGKGVCEPDCANTHSVCLDSCPKEAIYTLKKKEEEYCLCACPQFYRPKPGTAICELFCEEEKGLLPNSSEDGCDACSTDGLFFWQGECIRECPQGTLSNVFNSCRTCKQLNLWMDHTFKCVKFTDCPELSLFDYVNHICTRCDGEGMMVRKVFPDDFVCLKTECTDGHIIEGKISKCFVCPSGWFFSDEMCFKACPDDLYNDYNRFICTENCFESCSEDCCVNGSCKIVQGKSECTCEEGFYGEKCDITLEDIPRVVNMIQSILIEKLKENLFTRADTNALIEFYFYAKKVILSRRQLIKIDSALTSNLRTFINESKIEFAFQPTILGLVDSLILIEQLTFLQTSESTGLDSAINLLDTMTDDIQIFLTQNSEIGDFERIFEGKYRGQSFTFQFGTDIQETTEVDVSKCIERIIEKENLTFGIKFAFKLLRFSSEIEANVTRTFPHAFNLSSTGKFELTIYKESGLYPLNEVCLENYVDTTEQVSLEPEKKEATQKFATIGINVFDITVPFFNDKCVPYESEDGKDLTLAERKAQLYKNPSELCAESAAKVCSVDGFTPEGEAICVCKGIQSQKKSSLQSFASTYPQTNYILITCYDTFRQSDIFRNVGFYVVFLSFLTFSTVGIRSIFRSDSEIHSIKRFTFIRNDTTFYEPESMNIEVYFESCYSLKETLSMHVIETADSGELLRTLTEEEKKALFMVLPTVSDLKYLSFEQLLEFDRRSHFQFAIDTLIERNSLFNTFYMDSLTFPKYFRIMFFVTELNLNIALNAFFIDDSLVESFNQQEETGFLYSLTNEGPKTFWAFLTTKFIMTIFKALYQVGKRNHDNLLRRMKTIEADYLKRAFNRFLLKMRFASLAFSFVAILFNLFCAYFVIIFCEIYKNSIDIWINGIYMGWIFDYLVLGGFVPLLLLGSRYLATKNPRLSFLYKLSNVVDIMLSLELE